MSIRKIIDAIVENKAVEANDMLKETMNNIVAEKLLEAKKIVATRFGIEDYAGLNEAKEATGNLKDTCWKGYTAVGLKTKDGKKVPNCVPVNEEVLDEANIQRMGRVKLIKARIRGGKLQRRKKLSAVKGFTLRGGKLVRMSAQEKMKRKRGARKAKIKRRAKAARIRMKYQRALRKRKSLGLK